MVATDSIMRSPEKRFPDLEMIPDIAHPDTFLYIPSLTGHTSSKLELINKGVHHTVSSVGSRPNRPFA